MLTSLAVSNFSIFQELQLRFTGNLNIIVGENSTGKSHLLKLAYVLCAIQSESSETSVPAIHYHLDERIAEKLVAVFRPDFLGGLVNRSSVRSRCKVESHFMEHGALESSLGFSFAPNSRKKVSLETHKASRSFKEPVMMPPKEILTIFPSLSVIHDRRELFLDETYYDLSRKFLAGPLQSAKLAGIVNLIDELESILQGKIILEHGRFYVHTRDKGRLEVGLLAEGLRKIAQLAYLLLNGALSKGSTLFWDEPDANLNPKLIRKVAKALMVTAQSGIQIVIATHNLFLLRELALLRKDFSISPLFTGLECNNSGAVAHQADELEGLPNITALDEELEQSDRYLEQHLESAT
ncbi:ATPase/GTPase, AAA15 family [Desulfonatronum thiosulfatophilum]|uniref:ATPase/GTPase, AAA15 family n=1 Tax=Desulfonatronum thiosulfatophilum TaxID=617002 RepID=A0A1G6D888_9BACT|nr:ATP-binding protein [Desulfonatronum thiosulfatophilum]SDB41105.1 ATPase/GTPase, AAA15 family [Desulfonatronum thiosulfatophilum]